MQFFQNLFLIDWVCSWHAWSIWVLVLGLITMGHPIQAEQLLTHWLKQALTILTMSSTAPFCCIELGMINNILINSLPQIWPKVCWSFFFLQLVHSLLKGTPREGTPREGTPKGTPNGTTKATPKDHINRGYKRGP